MDSKVYRHCLGTAVFADRLPSFGDNFKLLDWFSRSLVYSKVTLVFWFWITRFRGSILHSGLRLRGSVGNAVVGKLRPSRLIRCLSRLGCLS